MRLSKPRRRQPQQARAAFDAAQRQLDVIASEKRQVNAALAGAIADRDAAKLNLSYTELRAPIDGTIGNRTARAGSYATVGAQLLSIIPARGKIVQRVPVRIALDGDATALDPLRPGLSVSVDVDEHRAE
ncbi:MAG TPA: HlyD family efflux transporter periplasmic adaptor subunit [Stellaceae bacterium]|jgi:multidrug resistance efflux pump